MLNTMIYTCLSVGCHYTMRRKNRPVTSFKAMAMNVRLSPCKKLI